MTLTVDMPMTSLGRILTGIRLRLEFAWSAGLPAMQAAQIHDAPAARNSDICAADSRDVRMARDGDHQAFERIIRRHQQEIASRLRRFSRDALVLEELVQETFVQAYFSLDRYRADAPLIHWLHRIGVRAGYRHWKARQSRPAMLAIEPHMLVARGPHERDVEELGRVMDQLGVRDRLVLTLMYLEDRSVHETALLTGWSKTMVKVQAYRARARLRKLMQSRHDGLKP
jgi:RNA polymerase sigma-70 factor, ECF subfamily